jgi:hypothetical protein
MAFMPIYRSAAFLSSPRVPSLTGTATRGGPPAAREIRGKSGVS